MNFQCETGVAAVPEWTELDSFRTGSRFPRPENPTRKGIDPGMPSIQKSEERLHGLPKGDEDGHPLP